MTRVSIKKGDVFEINLKSLGKKYFQYVANDLTQLNSDVIRVFKKKYRNNESPSLTEIVQGEADFYAHCVIKFGVKLGYWKKVGNISYIENVDVIFRSSEDDGNPDIKISEKWWQWKINEEQIFLGKLEGKYKDAEIGSVIPPDSIVYRVETGIYDFVYPAFE